MNANSSEVLGVCHCWIEMRFFWGALFWNTISFFLQQTLLTKWILVSKEMKHINHRSTYNIDKVLKFLRNFKSIRNLDNWGSTSREKFRVPKRRIFPRSGFQFHFIRVKIFQHVGHSCWAAAGSGATAQPHSLKSEVKADNSSIFLSLVIICRLHRSLLFSFWRKALKWRKVCTQGSR